MGADHFFRFPPVLPYAHGAAILPDDLDRLVGERAQPVRIGAAEPRLDTSALSGTQEKLLGDGIGVRVILVNVLLNCGQQPVDLVFVIHIDQELHVSSVLPFRGIDQQKAETAASDERRDMGNTGLGLDEALDGVGKRL